MAQPQKLFKVEPSLTQPPAHKLLSSASLESEIEKLACNDRVRTFVVGQSSGGKNIHLLAISSPENLAQLSHHKQAAQSKRRIVNYRTLSDFTVTGGGEEKNTDYVPSVLIHWGSFGFEAAHAEAAIRFAHLLTGGQWAAAEEILRHLIVLILPMVNPGGSDIAREQWQQYPLSAGFSGAGNEQGFFLNRDYYRLSQPETRAVHGVCEEWHPLAAIDPHEDLLFLGIGSPEHDCYAPPYKKPHHPHVENTILGFVNRLGTAITEAWRKRGYSVLHDPENGAMLQMLGMDGRIDLLMDLRGTPTIVVESARALGVQSWEDRVEQKLIAVQTFLTCCLDWKQELLHHQHQFWFENVNRGQTEPPGAVIVPRQRSEQADIAMAIELVELLCRHGIQVYTADAPYPCWIVPMGQPARAIIRTLMLAEPWNLSALPVAYGVTSYTLSSLPSSVQDQFCKTHLKTYEPGEPDSDSIPSPPSGWLIDNNVFGVRLVNDLLKLGEEVRWNIDDDPGDNKGAFFVPSPPPDLALSSQARRVVQRLVTDPGDSPRLQRRRVALYADQGVDERNLTFRGDSSNALSLMGFDFDLVNAEEIREGKLMEFDALLIPGGDVEEILHGWRTDLPFNQAPWELPGTSRGLGKDGVSSICQFIERGGTYIGISAGGGALAAKEYGGFADVSITAHSLGQACVLLRFADHPVTRGTRHYRAQDGTLHQGLTPAIYYSEPVLLAQGGPLFKVGNDAISVADYEYAENESWTGYLPDGTAAFCNEHSAIVYQEKGDGNIVLFGINPDFRMTWFTTYRLISNALFIAGEKHNAG